MPETAGDDGSLGAGARRGNAAARALGARRATAGSSSARIDAPRGRGATRRRPSADAPSRAARCPGAAAGQ
jgi:hypothetical protein